MEKIKNLQKLLNYDAYLFELMSGINKQDKNVINKIFNTIDFELLKLRSESICKRTSKNLKTWDNPELHFRALEQEKVLDLKMEFDDNLGLFQLASLVNYEPIMIIEFAKMLKNLNDIRQITNIKKARSEKKWNDYELHFKAVEEEKKEDLKNEITDLISLYNIAKSSNYSKGIELITNRLNEIAPNLSDVLIPKNSGTVRK